MTKNEGLSRRAFLQGATASTVFFALGAQAEGPAAAAAGKPDGPPVPCGVIGTGPQGRAIVSALTRIPGAEVVAICDAHPSPLRVAAKGAPKAATEADYRKLLERKEISTIFVATPSHQHREVVLNALQAGKNVYCEAPLAHTVEDARAIATAAKAAKSVFQVGQQLRSSPLYRHAYTFIHSGALGQWAQARAQWHRRQSWRRAAATEERARELNWRLYKATSPGLLGEIGLHQIDTVTWALRKLPVSVQGFGGILQWRDGREVADTVQCVIEYPGGVRLVYDATLANSFDGSYQLLQGSESAVLLREERAWMFKEADAPQLGWEIYAHKEKLGDEVGIALVANATKILEQGKKPGEAGTLGEKGKDALYYSVEAFLQSIREKTPVACGAEEGLQAAVVAIKANEAVVSGSRIAYQKEWFTL